jgi:hypothetical protein
MKSSFPTLLAVSVPLWPLWHGRVHRTCGRNLAVFIKLKILSSLLPRSFFFPTLYMSSIHPKVVHFNSKACVEWAIAVDDVCSLLLTTSVSTSLLYMTREILPSYQTQIYQTDYLFKKTTSKVSSTMYVQ